MLSHRGSMEWCGMKRLYARVTGRVHGVGYRDFVRRQAMELGLTGWVRNTGDGAVEVLAEGEDVALAHLVLRLEKGPRLARVEEVDTDYAVPTGEYGGFSIVT